MSTLQGNAIKALFDHLMCIFVNTFFVECVKSLTVKPATSDKKNKYGYKRHH